MASATSTIKIEPSDSLTELCLNQQANEDRAFLLQIRKSYREGVWIRGIFNG